MYIFTKNGQVLHTGPLPNSGVPSNDAAGDASMLLDADSRDSEVSMNIQW